MSIALTFMFSALIIIIILIIIITIIIKSNRESKVHAKPRG